MPRRGRHGPQGSRAGNGGLNAELEQRVIERTAQLEAANKELEAFAYSVSHDLASAIAGNRRLFARLQEDYADKLDAEGQRLIGMVRDGVGKMARLIDDILALFARRRAAR